MFYFQTPVISHSYNFIFYFILYSVFSHFQFIILLIIISQLLVIFIYISELQGQTSNALLGNDRQTFPIRSLEYNLATNVAAGCGKIQVLTNSLHVKLFKL